MSAILSNIITTYELIIDFFVNFIRMCYIGLWFEVNLWGLELFRVEFYIWEILTYSTATIILTIFITRRALN